MNDPLSQSLIDMVRISNRTDLPLKQKLQGILIEVLRAIGAEKGSIMINRDDVFLEVVAATKPELIGVRQRLSEKSPATHVFLHLKPLYMENGAEKDTPLRNKYTSYNKDAFLIVPLFFGDRAIGVLSVTEKSGEDQFSPQEREIVITFAGQLISAIENDRLNESLKENQAHIEQKNRELKALEKLRVELFNMLIHDLKGPVSEIMANIDILSYTVNEENLEYVQAAQSGCDVLYRMTSDLINITQLEEGSLKLVQEAIDPGDILSEVISRIHSIARTRSVHLSEKRPAEEDPIRFCGDRSLLLRVLQNLLMNAMHHSPQNETVEIGYGYENGAVTFYVTDQGPGVAPEFQNAIFDKFFQVKKQNDGRIYTTGLGLAFSKMAVEAHGGVIRVESDGKKGSCFSFTLPEGDLDSPL